MCNQLTSQSTPSPSAVICFCIRSYSPAQLSSMMKHNARVFLYVSTSLLIHSFIHDHTTLLFILFHLLSHIDRMTDKLIDTCAYISYMLSFTCYLMIILVIDEQDEQRYVEVRDVFVHNLNISTELFCEITCKEPRLIMVIHIPHFAV